MTVHIIIGLTATLAFSGIIIVLLVVYTVLANKEDECKRESKRRLTTNAPTFLKNIDDCG